jgi:hypothetical protein
MEIVLRDDNVALTVKVQHVRNCPCEVTCMMVRWKTIRKKFIEFISVQLTRNGSNSLL